MSKQQTIVGRTVDAAIAKFPSASSHALGRILAAENPLLFKDSDAARALVRTARGAHGKGIVHLAKFAPSPFSKDSLATFPDGKQYFDEEWAPVQVSGEHKTLVLSDIHIPYHERTPLLAAIEYGKDRGADTVLLNGDIADFYAASFWETDPNKRDFAGELKLVRQFLQLIRQEFPKARIIYKLGNHEERWERFIIHKAPEVYGVEEFKIGSLLNLSKFRMELVKDCRPVRIGRLNVLHGHEYRFAISNPVNPARGLFLRCKAFSMCGHFHQSSYHTEKTVEENMIATWSTGCLCQLRTYRPLNNWGYGFAFVETDKEDKFDVHHKVIRGGKVY